MRSKAVKAHMRPARRKVEHERQQQFLFGCS
jgi:hypothetical protein